MRNKIPYKHTEESKAKLRGKRMPSIKYHHPKSLEHRKNLSESRKKLYQEGKINVSGKNNGMYGKIPWNKGIPRNEETKKKVSETKKKLYKEGKYSVWNKGLTKEKDSRVLISSNKYKERRKEWICPKFNTSIEVKIQNYLKELKIGFFTHIYMDEILNSYQCDILIPVQKNKDHFIKQPIVIECDGDYWHCFPIGTEIDKIRTSELLEKGFKVLRLWESEIKVMDLNKFREKILC